MQHNSLKNRVETGYKRFTEEESVDTEYGPYDSFQLSSWLSRETARSLPVAFGKLTPNEPVQQWKGWHITATQKIPANSMQHDENKKTHKIHSEKRKNPLVLQLRS